MAKKARTPPPPRRPVQAPQTRSDPKSGGNRRTLVYLVVFAATGIVILGGVLLLIALGGSGDDGAKTPAALADTLKSEGCTLKTYPDQGQKHFTSPTQTFDYNSSPPTSGSHEPSPAIWNLYDEPIDERILVHNLEHGGIVIQYGKDIPQPTVGKITDDFYRPNPNGIILAPLPKLGDKIAMTAWTHLATCKKFNEDAFVAFRDAYRAKGPEKFTLDQLRQGT
jgi:hypothetical protein